MRLDIKVQKEYQQQCHFQHYSLCRFHSHFHTNKVLCRPSCVSCMNILEISSPEAWIVFFSPDTDVLVLALAHYEKLCKNTAICMVSGTLEIEPIWNALGRDKAAALAVFHAFTGADTVGRFSGIGKTKWFQQYMKSDRDIISALMKLAEEGILAQEVKDTLANFVCMVYCPKGIHITTDLRWHLFCPVYLPTWGEQRTDLMLPSRHEESKPLFLT